jgi:hypothetical protein
MIVTQSLKYRLKLIFDSNNEFIKWSQSLLDTGFKVGKKRYCLEHGVVWKVRRKIYLNSYRKICTSQTSALWICGFSDK